MTYRSSLGNGEAILSVQQEIQTNKEISALERTILISGFKMRANRDVT